MADGMVVLDRNQRIQFLNSSARSLLSEALPLQEQAPFALALSPGETKEIELRRVQNEFLVLEMRSFNTIWEGGEAVLVSLQDITRRRVQERQIHDQQQRLEEANAKLQALASEDGLTGLKNHRAFKDAFRNLFDQSEHHQQPLSVILIDVDRFKAFNDSFGHPAGDEVLKQVARIIAENVRPGDHVARYGGEEFVVVLPKADRCDANAVAERIRRAIENAPWKHRQVTASLGISTRSNTAADPAALLAESDEALYASKQGGRNRVTQQFMLRRSKMYS